jgi:hypothetical protein
MAFHVQPPASLEVILQYVLVFPAPFSYGYAVLQKMKKIHPNRAFTSYTKYNLN